MKFGFYKIRQGYMFVDRSGYLYDGQTIVEVLFRVFFEWKADKHKVICT